MRVYYTNAYRKKFNNRSFSHILLEKVLREGCGIADPVIVREEGVRPVLDGGHGILFSVTHTDNIWMCAVSDRNVGIDIERTSKQVVNAKALAVRFLDEAEKECVLEGGEDELNMRFLYCWTRKEALLKFTGEGLKGLKDAGSIVGDTVQDDGYGEIFLRTVIREGLFISIASEVPVNGDGIELVCLDDSTGKKENVKKESGKRDNLTGSVRNIWRRLKK